MRQFLFQIEYFKKHKIRDIKSFQIPIFNPYNKKTNQNQSFFSKSILMSKKLQYNG